MDLMGAYHHTTDVVARQRISEEAQEGMNAFLEKRKPNWQENS
jgi:methylglutaconyl-CoA hydratase